MRICGVSGLRELRAVSSTSIWRVIAHCQDSVFRGRFCTPIFPSPRPHMFTMTLVMLDPPGPFDTLATWERHLAYLRCLPADTLLRDEMLRTAEAHIATSSPAT